MATKSKITYTAKDVLIYNALKGAPVAETDEGTFDGLTFRELKSIIPDLATGSVNSAVKKGIVEVVGSKTETETIHRKNAVYKVVDLSTDRVGADGKAINYTDKEKAILTALAEMQPKDGLFTLKALAEFMDTNLSSGNINALVNKKGNIEKTDLTATVTVIQDKRKPSNVYGLADELPVDFINFLDKQGQTE